MIKDVVSNFFYNKNPYPVITKARKKPEPAPQPLTKRKTINTTNTMASAPLKNKDNSYNSNNWLPHPVGYSGCGCFSKL